MVLDPKLGFNAMATLSMLRVSGELWQVRAQECTGHEAKHMEPNSECWLPGFVASGLLCKDSPGQAQFSSRVRGFSSGDCSASGLVAPCVVHHLSPRASTVPGTKSALTCGHIFVPPCPFDPQEPRVHCHNSDAAKSNPL